MSIALRWRVKRSTALQHHVLSFEAQLTNLKCARHGRTGISRGMTSHWKILIRCHDH